MRIMPLVGVIDPGHGGKDPGCRGAQAVEKELTLLYGLEVAAELRARGHRITLTREDDRYLALAERTQITNAASPKADFFVSVHFDWNSNPAARGTWSLYFNNVQYETSLTSRDRGYIVSQTPSPLGKPLADAITRCVTGRSGTSARYNQGRPFYWWSTDENRWMREGQLYVLRYTRPPAVICEVCFLSNPDDEAMALRDDFRRAVAVGIADGIEEWGRRYLGK